MSQSNTRKSYGQWCPVAKALDLVGDRWTLLIVRDLLCGDRRYSDLRNNLVGISPTLLSTRLRDLAEAGVLTHVDGDYRLTARGRDLETVVLALGQWGVGELLAPQRTDHFPDDYRLIGLRSLVNGGRPQGPSFVALVVLDHETLTLRVSVEHGCGSVDVRAGSPENPTVSVVASLASLNLLHLGHASLDELERAGDVTISGSEQAKSEFLALIVL